MAKVASAPLKRYLSVYAAARPSGGARVLYCNRYPTIQSTFWSDQNALGIVGYRLQRGGVGPRVVRPAQERWRGDTAAPLLPHRSARAAVRAGSQDVSYVPVHRGRKRVADRADNGLEVSIELVRSVQEIVDFGHRQASEHQ